MSEPTCGDLTGLTAVVTGSSSGIGRAMSLELAAAGAACIIHARKSQQQAKAVVEEICLLHGQATMLLADVGDLAGHAAFVDAAWQWRGAVDIWINNAGADTLTGDAAEWSFDRKLQELWRVDVAGAMGLAREVGRRMKSRGSGVVINVGWDQAEHGMAGDSGELFAATKGAIMAFSKSLARSLAPQVRVNCVAPGWIRTAWGEGASQYWQQRAERESLLARWGTPQDVARAVRFLASPAAAFITGQILPVNGGLKPS